MTLTICTWNINSVRLREETVLRLLREEAPDILCLQETKCPVDKIPVEGFAALGYGHVVCRGQKGYNGVAILSRVPIEDAGQRDFCAKGDARHVAARLASGTVIHNFYVPAGGDVPDLEANAKFAHKLDFVAEMTDWGRGAGPDAVLVGDLNIAPREDDVWSHKQLLKVVSHTPVETERLAAVRQGHGWTSPARISPTDSSIPGGPTAAQTGRLPTRGRRLDHIWATPDLAARIGRQPHRPSRRGWEKPSDHAPVFAEFEWD